MIEKFDYEDGSLYAICRFLEGQKEGLQEFFYSNGNLKTKEFYQCGRLHGTIQLYWENGQLKREVHFQEGIRSGFDRIWNCFGVLVDEGFYHEGKPQGTHLRFDDEGRLIEEIIYLNPSFFNYRAWDEKGNLLIEGVWEDDLHYRERRLYRNNLKNRFLAASAFSQNSHAHLCLASRQWSLAPHENFEEPSCQTPDSSGCFGIGLEKRGKKVGSHIVFEEEKIAICPVVEYHLSDASYSKNLVLLMERFKSLSLLVPSFSGSIQKTESLENVEIGKAENIYVYGLGNGVSYFQFTSWLHQDPKRRLIFLEDDPEAFHSFLHFENNEKLLLDSQVHLEFFSQKSFDAGALTKQFPSSKVDVFSLPSKDQRKFKALKGKIFRNSALSSAIHLDRWHGFLPFSNFLQNVKQLPHSFYANRLKGAFHNVPAIICGAGPTLTDAISHLKEAQNKALIIAGGSTIAALSSHGVDMHFGIAVDPNLEEYRRFKNSFAFETPILYSTRVHPKIFQTCNGPFGYMRSGFGGMLELWMEEKLSLDDPFIGEDLSSDAVSVTSSAIAWAVFLGCNPIFLSGVDLAYLNQKQYAKGVGVDDEISFSLLDLEKSAADRILRGKNYQNQEVITATRWIMERSSLSHFAKKNRKIRFFNTSNQGLAIPNIPFLSFEEAKKTYLHRDFDVKHQVQKCIVNASLKNTKEIIDSKINDLKESLDRVIDHLSILAGMRTGIKAISEIEMPEEEAYLLLFYDIIEILQKEGVKEAHLSSQEKWEKFLALAQKYRAQFECLGKNPTLI